MNKILICYSFLLCFPFHLLAQIQQEYEFEGQIPSEGSGWSVSVSLEGNHVAIGAPFNSISARNAGQTRVFTLAESHWVQLGSAINGEYENDNSGVSVALSSNGMRIAIGAYQNSQVAMESGQVRIFNWDGKDWAQLGKEINGDFAGDHSGYSVSLSSDGNLVAIGSPTNSLNGTEAGLVRVFRWQGNYWEKFGTDIYGIAEFDALGTSVAFSSSKNYLAVGAPSSNGAGPGYAMVFFWNGNTWSQIGRPIRGIIAGEQCGGSISISSRGTRLAIGSKLHDQYGEESGLARVFEWDRGNWAQIGQSICGQDRGDQVGVSVALSKDGTRLAVGAIQDDDRGEKEGRVRVFDWGGDKWVQVGQNILGHEPSSQFGHSISISGDGKRMVAGAPFFSGLRGQALLFMIP